MPAIEFHNQVITLSSSTLNDNCIGFDNSVVPGRKDNVKMRDWSFALNTNDHVHHEPVKYYH